MDATLRDYAAADENAVVDVSLRAWEPVFESVRATLGAEIDARLHGEDWRIHQEREVRETLGREATRTWVAELGGRIVGFAAAAVADPERGIGAILLLAVDPRQQRRGIGTALTHAATEWLRSTGMRVAFIGTGGDAGHEPARRLYAQASYTPFPVVQYYKAL